MANIKSAEKRIKVTKAKTEQNRAVKSALSTEIKKYKAAPTQPGLDKVVSMLDRAVQDSIIHKNKANRNKASLAKLLVVKK